MGKPGSKGRVLIVVTGHEQFGDLERRTGYWLSEVTHFYELLHRAGYELDIVSPNGGRPPVDEKSAGVMDRWKNRAVLKDPEYIQKMENTLRPDQVDPKDYRAIYYAGGHGVMWDVPENTAMANLASKIFENGGVVSAVCHGPCGILNVKLSNGKYLVDGRKVTGFANVEEGLLRLTPHVPYLLEEELKKRGGTYKRSLPFVPYAVADGRLVTGQNPFSSKAVARRVIKVLEEQAPA